MAAKKKAAAKKVAAATKSAEPKAKREPALKFGHDLRISGVPSENWRREGTANYDRAKEVMAFMKKNPRATVADLIAGTSYRRNDFEWDQERKVFKVTKA